MMADERESGSRHYIEQVVRSNLGNLIEAWRAAGEPQKAAACAQLAVAQGVWSHPWQRHRDHVPGLTAQPLHDTGGFWFTGLLEERFPEIRAEISSMVDSAEVVLFRDGRWQENVSAALPVTRAALEQMPEVTTFNPGTITISRLSPGTHLTQHGATNAVLRLYLPVSGAEGGWIRVADETVHWTEGRCVVLDDSFERELKHDGATDFLVLILDLVHPGLDPAHRIRLLPGPTTAEERVVAFMRERGIEELSYRDGEVMLHPGEEMRQLIFQYMRAADVAGVEFDGEQARWLQPAAETA
uniref:Aspartyl/asparaginyl beta-hydroxylase n=1 Tax=uncultured bacterium esnapd14 TaxID=1366594 RepID=S5TL47_9BACT|nr:aspartyl/asparaginyl beta-hydroxylase [uncultured bacterium esnapd14]